MLIPAFILFAACCVSYWMGYLKAKDYYRAFYRKVCKQVGRHVMEEQYSSDVRQIKKIFADIKDWVNKKDAEPHAIVSLLEAYEDSFAQQQAVNEVEEILKNNP